MKACRQSDSKRRQPSADERPTKRRGQGRGSSQHVTQRLDRLCDNSLLHVLSFADLKSTVRLTRCTSKVLKERFDPAVDSADECRAIWQPILLDMTGRGESVGFASPLAAIDYHMRLLKMAVTPGAIKQRHYSVMPLSGSWKYSGVNFPRGATLDDLEIMYPFDLISPGIGREYTIIDPKTHRVNIGEDILEHAVCLEESLQKKRAMSDDYKGPETLESTVRQYIEPTIKQTLLESNRHSLRNEVIDNEWDNYFGENSAFKANQIPAQSVRTGTSMITVQDENILFLRMVFPQNMRGNAGGVVCMETLVYSPSAAGFELTHTCQMAGLCVGLDARPPKNDLFAFFDATDDSPDQDRRVFRYPLIETDQQGQISSFYPGHTAVFTAQNPVGAVLGMEELLYIGTSFGRVEVWDIASSTRLRFVTCSINGAPINSRFNSVYPLSFANTSLGFVAEQKDEATGMVFSFWQPDAVLNQGFNVAALLTYSNCFPVVRCTDERVLILAYDEVGNLFLDVYLIRIHSHAETLIEALDVQSTPRNVNLIQPTGGHKNPLFFAQRIDLNQRVFVQKLDRSSAYTPEFLHFSVNRRFVAVNLHRGLGAGDLFNPSGDWNAMSGPGILLLDLDEDGISLNGKE